MHRGPVSWTVSISSSGQEALEAAISASASILPAAGKPDTESKIEDCTYERGEHEEQSAQDHVERLHDACGIVVELLCWKMFEGCYCFEVEVDEPWRDV